MMVSKLVRNPGSHFAVMYGIPYSLAASAVSWLATFFVATTSTTLFSSPALTNAFFALAMYFTVFVRSIMETPFTILYIKRRAFGCNLFFLCPRCAPRPKSFSTSRVSAAVMFVCSVICEILARNCYFCNSICTYCSIVSLSHC